MRQKSKLWMLSIVFILVFPVLTYAATPINLNHQKGNALTSFPLPPMKEISRSFDFKKNLHIKIKQTYQGYEVWGSDAILHIPRGVNLNENLSSALMAVKHQGSMNGFIYDGINQDLGAMPPPLLNGEKVEEKAVAAYSNSTITNKQSQLMVYVDKKNKSHWIYHVNFYVAPTKENPIPAKPHFLIDAKTFQIYKKWNEVKTHNKVNVDEQGGGLGGNEKMGKLIYDGLSDHLSALSIYRDAKTKTCSLRNKEIAVKNASDGKIIQFPCNVTDPDHGEVYWDGDLDAVNGGFSPANDALFSGMKIKNMYQDWYHEAVLTKNGKPMILNMVVHEKMDNAYWDSEKMVFGDGVQFFYPLTSLGVASHEISHGFTEQHSGLIYDDQSGGMNESFSDMAAKAAEFYAYGHNNWEMGSEILKEKNKSLRYMDQPSKDCHEYQPPGEFCSIDNVHQYNDELDVHFSSGIFNRAFYLLATSPNWSTKTAFDLMVYANQFYWTPNSNFFQGACGVMSAAMDLMYPTEAVIAAFEKVGMDLRQC